jgi:hypothetical protein
MMMRVVLLAALLLVTAACGAYAFPGHGASPTPDTGTVSGRVLLFPCAPVEIASSPCPGKVASGLEIDYVNAGTIAGRTVTDGSGSYVIRLEPGSYTVVFKSYMRVMSGPTKITIAAGSNLVANYVLDSGIRTAVPAQ